MQQEQKKAGVAILISDKTDLKIKKITRDKEEHYIMIKGSTQEENITIVNIYVPNIGAPQYIRQALTDIKGEIDSNTIVVGALTPHSHKWTDYQNRKLIRKHKSYDKLDEMDLIDIFRTFHPNAEYTFFSSAHGTFSRLDHILSHKSNLSKFKKIEIVSSIFSDYTAMRLGSITRENCKKHKHKDIKQYVSK